MYKPDVREAKKHGTNDLFKSYLELSSFRRKTLVQNVAIVNTPGYKANEVEMLEDFDDFIGKGRTARKISMAKTSFKHIGASKDSSGKFVIQKFKDPYEVKKRTVIMF